MASAKKTMAVATLSRSLSRSLFSNSPNFPHSRFTMPFSSSSTPSDFDSESSFAALQSDSDAESPSPNSSSARTASDDQKAYNRRPLENGVDVGIYRAILVGQVGQNPFQKTLRNGMNVTLISLGTGGIRNNRRPLDHEDPKDYENRCSVQWHRVSIYPERLGDTVMKHAKPGAILYVEGNLESKIFNDPISGLVRRIREIAVRRNGRLVFLGNSSNTQNSTQTDLKGVGYY